MKQSGPRGTDEPATDEPPADAETETEAEAGVEVEAAPTDEREWQFSLDEVGPDGVVEDEPEPIEPEKPKLENVVFVLLGVVGTLFLLSTVI
jgi:hypothetical protein